MKSDGLFTSKVTVLTGNNRADRPIDITALNKHYNTKVH